MTEDTMAENEKRPASRILTTGIGRSLAGIALMASVLGGTSYGEPSDLERENERRFCGLPSCKKEYNHRGNYCCKEHCTQHRKEIKQK